MRTVTISVKDYKEIRDILSLCRMEIVYHDSNRKWLQSRIEELQEELAHYDPYIEIEEGSTNL